MVRPTPRPPIVSVLLSSTSFLLLSPSFFPITPLSYLDSNGVVSWSGMVQLPYSVSKNMGIFYYPEEAAPPLREVFLVACTLLLSPLLVSPCPSPLPLIANYNGGSVGVAMHPATVTVPTLRATYIYPTSTSSLWVPRPFYNLTLHSVNGYDSHLGNSYLI